MPGLQATDLLATLLACSGRRHNQLCRLSHECKLGDQTRDDADKEPRDERSCGRSQTSLYNGRRLHQALGYRAPMAVWRERMQAAKAVDMMDNADALTTCPQQQQQTEPLAADRKG